MPGLTGISRATYNSRSLNIRVPMTVVRSIWPDIPQGTAFEWAAYPAIDCVIMRRLR